MTQFDEVEKVVGKLAKDLNGDVKSKNVGKYILYFCLGFLAGVITTVIVF